MITDLSNPSILQSLQLAATGVLVGAFVYLPVFLLILPEFNKFATREVAEHHSGSSYFILLGKSFFYFPLAAVAAVLVSVVVESIFPGIGNIYGEGGLINSFWLINVDDIIEDESLPANNLSILYFVKLSRMSIEGLSFYVNLIFFYLSIRVLIEIFIFHESKPLGFVSVMYKGMIVFCCTALLSAWFSASLSGTLQHPEHTITKLSVDYITESIRLYVPNFE